LTRVVGSRRRREVQSRVFTDRTTWEDRLDSALPVALVNPPDMGGN
jgi:hypothetical protein